MAKELRQSDGLTGERHEKPHSRLDYRCSQKLAFHGIGGPAHGGMSCAGPFPRLRADPLLYHVFHGKLGCHPEARWQGTPL